MTKRDTRLHGSWRLVPFKTEPQEAKERTQPWGANPDGSLVFGADKHMMVLLTAKVREPGSTDEKLAALFCTIMAYTRRYRVRDDRFITKVDASWNGTQTGARQERSYMLDGDKLEARTAWIPNPLVSENTMGRNVLGFGREQRLRQIRWQWSSVMHNPELSFTNQEAREA